MVRAFALIMAVTLACSSPVLAAGEGDTLPAVAEQDCDGSRYVWSVYQEEGLPYDYVPAGAFPQSDRFAPAPEDAPQPGDVAWWGDYMAVHDPRAPEWWNAPPEYSLRTAIGLFSLPELEARFGRVQWFRYVGRVNTELEGGPTDVIKGK